MMKIKILTVLLFLGMAWFFAPTLKLGIACPVLEIISPRTTIYSNDTVLLSFVLSEPTAWMSYSIDGETNVTIVGNTTLTGLSNGWHSLVVYANSTDGEYTGISNVVTFATFVNMQLVGYYRNWKVMLQDDRIYVYPPQTMTNELIVVSIGTWDQAYYSSLGWTVIDAAKPYIDECMACYRDWS